MCGDGVEIIEKEGEGGDEEERVEEETKMKGGGREVGWHGREVMLASGRYIDLADILILW